MPVRAPERELGGVAAGRGGAAGDAGARAGDQLRQGRHEAPRLAVARRRPLRRLARLRRLLLRRPPQRQRQVLPLGYPPSVKLGVERYRALALLC